MSSPSPIHSVPAETDPTQVDLEPWLHVGDPLAEAAWASIRRAGRRGPNVLVTIRDLAADGDAACQLLLADVETVPDWADFDAMRAGASWASANPVGMIGGLFAVLPLSYASANTSAVLVGRNNLVRAVPRRVFESAGLFVSALDVDGMRPGGDGWETAVRVRLMHTMVRAGILRSGAWEGDQLPINALETALGTWLFGTVRARAISEVAPRTTQEQVDSFHLMWRYLSRILGAPDELIFATAADQRILEGRMARRFYCPDHNSVALTLALHEATPHLGAGPRVPTAIAQAITRRLLSPELLPELDASVADGLGIPESRATAAVIRTSFAAARVVGQPQRVPAIGRVADRSGRAYLNRLVERGLRGTPADYTA